MSKTSQRKRQAYQDGLGDGSRGDGFRWRRHPYMQDYRRGFDQGRALNKARRSEVVIAQAWYMRLLYAIARRVGR